MPNETEKALADLLKNPAPDPANPYALVGSFPVGPEPSVLGRCDAATLGRIDASQLGRIDICGATPTTTTSKEIDHA
jgi:hypothetical protein